MFQRKENFDNKHMEQKIVSMLANVLCDSEEEEMNTEASSNKNIKEFKENFPLSKEESYFPGAIKKNNCSPTLFVNDNNFNQLYEPTAHRIKRKDKKCNSAKTCTYQNTIKIDANNPRAIDGSFRGPSMLHNISYNYRSDCHPLSISPLENLQNYNSQNSTLT